MSYGRAKTQSSVSNTSKLYKMKGNTAPTLDNRLVFRQYPLSRCGGDLICFQVGEGSYFATEKAINHCELIKLIRQLNGKTIRGYSSTIKLAAVKR